MVGYVTDAVATALKNWSALATANVIPLRAAAGDSVVIDTPIPAIVVHVFVDENDGNTFIGGGIRHYFRLELHYIAPTSVLDVLNTICNRGPSLFHNVSSLP